jgi:hypothetical protein
VSAVISATLLRLTINEDIDAASTFAGFTKHGTTATIGTGVLNGTRLIDFPVSGTLNASDVVTLDFDGTAGSVIDLAGNNLLAFTARAVGNAKAGGGYCVGTGVVIGRLDVGGKLRI